MKLDDLIALARSLQSSSAAGQLAIGVMDLLAESAPCGIDLAAVIRDDSDGPWISADWLHSEVSPEDARHMARMLLRAADEAEAK